MIEAKLSEIDVALENLRAGVEKGLPINFIKDRLKTLQKDEKALSKERESLSKAEHPEHHQIDVAEMKKQAMVLLEEFDQVFDSAPILKKKSCFKPLWIAS